MRHIRFITIAASGLLVSLYLHSQHIIPKTDSRDSVYLSVNDSLPRVIPDYLSPLLFIPVDRLRGMQPWTYAPMLRPVLHIHPSYGFSGSVGFGEYEITSPDKFFSSFAGYNGIDIPHLFLSEQMMLGNTLKLGRRFYFLSGIMYGSQMSIAGNNWGMGTREGFVWTPDKMLSVVFWTQYFQSVSVYSPVLFPDKGQSGAAIRMPATPEVFSFGVQANFVVGEFIIGVGTSVAPVPFQDRHHSEFRYK